MKRIITGVIVASLLLALSAVSAVGIAAGRQASSSANQMSLFGINLPGLASARNPEVFISKASAKAGDDLSVTGMFFPASTQVQVAVGQPSGQFFVISNAETDVDGKLNTTFTLPAIILNGTTTTTQMLVVEVIPVTETNLVAVSPAFVFTENEENQTTTTGQSVEILPSQTGTPNSLNVRITGMPANTLVRVRFLDRKGRIVFQTHVRTNANGRVFQTLVIPEQESNEASENEEANQILVAEVTTLEGQTIMITSQEFVFVTQEEANESQATTAATAVLPNTGGTAAPTATATASGFFGTPVATTTMTSTATAVPLAPATIVTPTATAPVTATGTTTPSVVLPSTGAQVRVALTRLATQSSGQFLVTAAGLPANTTVNVYVGTLMSQLTLVGHFNSDGNGQINTQVTLPATQVPSNTEAQENWVAVLTTTACPGQVFVSNTFNEFGH